jgi:hypothetical protein
MELGNAKSEALLFITPLALISVGLRPPIVALTVNSCLKVVHSRWRLFQIHYRCIFAILHRRRRGEAHAKIPYVVIGYFRDLPRHTNLNLGTGWFRVYFLQLPRCYTDVDFFNNSFIYSLWLIWLNDFLARFYCRAHGKLRSIVRGIFRNIHLDRRYMANTILIPPPWLMHADLFFEYLSLLLLPCYCLL